MHEVILDIETSGLSVESGGEIILLSACHAARPSTSRRIFQRLLKPNAALPDEVEKITGITNAMLQDAPRFEDVANKFLAFWGGARLIALDPDWERTFLNAALVKAGYAEVPVAHFINLRDRLPQAMRKLPKDEIYQLAGIGLRDATGATPQEVAVSELLAVAELWGRN